MTRSARNGAGDVMEAGRAVSLAETYLALLTPDSPAPLVDAYVRLAARYGVTVARIVEVSGLDQVRVEQIVRDG